MEMLTYFSNQVSQLVYGHGFTDAENEMSLFSSQSTHQGAYLPVLASFVKHVAYLHLSEALLYYDLRHKWWPSELSAFAQKGTCQQRDNTGVARIPLREQTQLAFPKGSGFAKFAFKEVR
jgi:hypothetical protein